MAGGRLSSCGFFVGPTAATSQPRTYVVLGVPRGGTSMSAGALRMAGVPMGEDITDNGNEDRAFLTHRGDVALFERADERQAYLSHLGQVIAERNRDHDVWGWKDPISALYLDDILRHLRNPHFILILRDPAAVAMREWSALPQAVINSASPNFYFDHLDRAQMLYARAIRSLRDHAVPGLVLSYERCLRYPDDFASRILSFTGMGLESDAAFDALAAKIAGYVTPDAVSGRLSSTQRDALLSRTFRNNAGFYGSIEDAYSACAGMVNSGKYPDALTLSASILKAGVDGGRAAPQFVVSPQRFAVIEGGLSFIRAVAFANTGDPTRALMEILKFKAAREFLALQGIADPLVEGLLEPVARLQSRVSETLFGQSAISS